MFRICQILLLVMAALAVGYVQVLDAQKSFICLHSYEIREVEEDHCHQEGIEEGFIPCASVNRNCCVYPTEAEHHIAVTVEFKTVGTNAVFVSAPAYVPVFILDSFFEIERLVVDAQIESIASAYSRGLRTDIVQLNSTVQAAKCMVLLV